MTARTAALAYVRTSSATNAGEGKDSAVRQLHAIRAYASANGLELVGEFEDVISGGTPISERPAFKELLAAAELTGAKMILVENASRLARELVIQELAHRQLKDHGFTLIAVDSPDSFVAEGAMDVLVRQLVGAVSQFEKNALKAKLKGARDRKSAAIGRRCEGRKAKSGPVVDEAHRLKHEGMSLRQVAQELARLGYVTAKGKPYLAGSVKLMLEKDTAA